MRNLRNLRPYLTPTSCRKLHILRGLGHIKPLYPQRGRGPKNGPLEEQLIRGQPSPSQRSGGHSAWLVDCYTHVAIPDNAANHMSTAEVRASRGGID
jgi:hypothetical protein